MISFPFDTISGKTSRQCHKHVIFTSLYADWSNLEATNSLSLKRPCKSLNCIYIGNAVGDVAAACLLMLWISGEIMSAVTKLVFGFFFLIIASSRWYQLGNRTGTILETSKSQFVFHFSLFHLNGLFFFSVVFLNATNRNVAVTKPRPFNSIYSNCIFFIQFEGELIVLVAPRSIHLNYKYFHLILFHDI